VDYLFGDGNLCVVKVGMCIPDQQVLHCLQPYVSELRTVDDLPLRNSASSECSATLTEYVAEYVSSDYDQTECMTEYVSSNDTVDRHFGEILLVLAAARNKEDEIENALRLLRQKGYRIRAVLIWQPDLRLLADYYALPYVVPGN
jgi:hypothetical protein